MKLRRNKAGTSGTSADSGPINLQPESHPSYRTFIKQARKAGKKGIPDPSRTTKAPSCFFALAEMTMDQLHHEVGATLDAIAPARQIIAANAHAEVALSGRSDLTEAEERRLMKVLEARESVRIAVQRCQPRLHSILAVYGRTLSDMQDAFRQYWPYASHFDELEFPVVSLDQIRYVESAGGLRLIEPLDNGGSVAGELS